MPPTTATATGATAAAAAATVTATAAGDIPTEATRRLQSKKQTLNDAYAAPANFLEIDVINPVTHGAARTKYTDYEVQMRVGRHAHQLVVY